ncbi:MAG: sigma-54-dependent Fis family transcriptional regulator [Phycisphaeraceae bacterium]|nr:sigma-54-dependent Fis family transcriptional regulator [Phycisphaeraceae bacterium]
MIVDDDPIIAESLAQFLATDGISAAIAGDGYEAMEHLDQGQDQHYGLVITDMNMPRCDGIELLKKIRKHYPDLSVIVITGYAKIQTAVESIKLGAVDYLTKPIIDSELRISIDKAMQHHALLAENKSLRAQLAERYGMGSIIGTDYRMQRVYDLIEAVAPSKTTVLIDGDSGTGKSLVARAVHQRSERHSGPFVTFSCGSIPETLLESELFGHVKGAFTGAESDKLGKIMAANGGTLFIDEINSATPALQLKLLRVLQERQFEPLGSTKTQEVDVRFVLATNKPLKAMVDAGTFREDLYYRINVVNIELPPLRERSGDISLLAEHFLGKYCKEMNKTITSLTAEANRALQKHNWPGNVRELENAIERAVVLSRRPVIDIDDLPQTIREMADEAIAATRRKDSDDDANAVIPALDHGWTPMPLQQALEEPERQILLAALKANDWNRQETAKQLNINRTTLYKKIKHYHLVEG